MAPYVLSLALVAASTAPSDPSVPVQRPSTLPPTVPAPNEEPSAEAVDAPPPDITDETPEAAAPPPEASPAVEPSTSAETSEPPPGPVADPRTAVLGGTVTDTEIAGVAMGGVRVVITCPCLTEPLTTFTNGEGFYLVDELPGGVYTIIADRGGPRSRQIVAVAPTEELRVDLRVAPPTTSEEVERRERESARAHTALAVGGLMGVTGGLLLIAGGVEAAKWDCKFDLQDCEAAPRPELARGLSLSGAVLMAGGAALVTWGVVRNRRLRATVAADDRGASLGIQGRF